MIKFKREIFSFSIGYLISWLLSFWAQANYLAHTLDHEVKKATGGSFLLARKCLTSGRKRFPSYAAWNWWPAPFSVINVNPSYIIVNLFPMTWNKNHNLLSDPNLWYFNVCFFFHLRKICLEFVATSNKIYILI